MFKGLGNLANLGSLIKQAQQMSAEMQKIGEELKKRRVEGTAGGGMVTVEATGAGEITSVRIDPKMFTADDREMVEDLIPAAVNAALAKAKALQAEAIQSTGDMPGMGEMLAQLTGGNPGDVPTP